MKKKKRDGGEKDNGCFIALVPNMTLIIIIIIIIIILLLLLLLLLLLFCVKFEFHGWYLKWKEGIWISEKKKKKPLNDGQSVHRLKLTKLRYSTLGSPLKI